MNRVLIIGFGSIGQRHAKALISLGVKQIAALRTGKGKKKPDKNLEEKILTFHSEDQAFNWKPTNLIISNPTSLHLSYIRKALDKGINFFVEKPIAEKFSDVQALLNNCNVKGYVGYNLRFHGLFRFIKKTIDSQVYGRLITAKLHVGQYLPNWHPYENYRDGYYAKKELGGGAIRTLSHEIDLMYYLFGDVKNIFAKVERLSDLQINVDDVTNIIAETDKCKQVIIHLNLLDPNIIRKGSIYFSSGVLDYDFMQCSVSFIENASGKESVIYTGNEKIDDQYILQMKHFITNVRSSIACSFTEGVNVIRIIESCEQSTNEKREICLV